MKVYALLLAVFLMVVHAVAEERDASGTTEDVQNGPYRLVRPKIMNPMDDPHKAKHMQQIASILQATPDAATNKPKGIQPMDKMDPSRHDLNLIMGKVDCAKLSGAHHACKKGKKKLAAKKHKAKKSALLEEDEFSYLNGDSNDDTFLAAEYASLIQEDDADSFLQVEADDDAFLSLDPSVDDMGLGSVLRMQEKHMRDEVEQEPALLELSADDDALLDLGADDDAFLDVDQDSDAFAIHRHSHTRNHGHGEAHADTDALEQHPSDHELLHADKIVEDHPHDKRQRSAQQGQ